MSHSVCGTITSSSHSTRVRIGSRRSGANAKPPDGPSAPHLDGKAEDLNAHAAHVGGGHLAHQAGEAGSILVDLLDGQGAW